MWVKREIDFDDLVTFFWSGARKNWVNATDDQRERVWDTIQDIFSDKIPNETEINDLVWFDWDNLIGNEEADESLSHRQCKARKEAKRCSENVDGDKETVYSTIMSDKNLRSIASSISDKPDSFSRKLDNMVDLVHRVSEEQGIMLDDWSMRKVAERVINEMDHDLDHI